MFGSVVGEEFGNLLNPPKKSSVIRRRTVIKFIYEFNPNDPLKIKYEIKNPYSYTIYIGKYSTPLDGVCSCWEITNENGNRAEYCGIRKKRIPMNQAKSAWQKIKGRGTYKQEVDLSDSFVVKGKIEDVKVAFQCEVARKISKVPISSETEDVTIIKLGTLGGRLELEI